MEEEFIPVANVNLGEEEARVAYEAIKSGWVSFLGPHVKEFERAFAEEVGAQHAIAVSSGTAALHTALAAIGVSVGDEVIIPSLTFISTANVVMYQGATPVMAECDSKTYNVTAEEIEKRITPKTKAIISVDMNGMPVEYDEIIALAEKHGVSVIADSAESLGATYKQRKVGSIAKIHIFSFFPNKNITTGEGGMITTSDEKLSEKMRVIMNQGQVGRYNHVALGYNYRMTNFQAGIGVEQLKKLSMVISEKEKLAQRYNEQLKECVSLTVPFVPEYVTQHAWYTYTVSVPPEYRDNVVEMLDQASIQTRLSFPPIHTQSYYKEKFGFTNESLPISFRAWSGLINIPLWLGMGEKQERVIGKLREICRQVANG